MTNNNRRPKPLTGFVAILSGIMLLAFGISGFFGGVSTSYAQADTTPGTGTTTAAPATTPQASPSATTSISNTTNIITATTAPTGNTTATAGATINVFCLNYQKTFPTGQTIKAQGLANAQVRGVLAYALSKGYISSQPYQVQLAIYALQDNQPFHDFRNEGTQIAQEIIANAGAAPSTGDSNALNNLTISNIQPASPDQFFGTGQIQGNVAASSLPVGFLLPAASPAFQSLVAVVVPTGAVASAPGNSTPVVTPTPDQTLPTLAPAITKAPFPTPVVQATPPPTVLGVAALPPTGAGGTSEVDNTGWLFTLGLLLVAIAMGFGVSYYGLGRKRL